LLRRSPAAVPDVQEGEHSGDDKEGEGKSHFEYGGAPKLQAAWMGPGIGRLLSS
jgi:hypothetical protein